MILDTHKFVENLVAAGFKKKQAEVFVQEINENQKELATKEDIALLRRETKEDIALLRSEVKEISANLKYDIVKWIIGIFISTMAINLTAIGFLARLLLK
jgi:hypothetical protein|tara:strand:- start:3429 stop:3728 length:300 start_codon:yes stop_codon:yes gene_type:complete